MTLDLPMPINRPIAVGLMPALAISRTVAVLILGDDPLKPPRAFRSAMCRPCISFV
jgi:hypothetical protein